MRYIVPNKRKVRTNELKEYDVIVVGGGAAGMMAAISAAKEGAEVALVEKNEKLGKKI